jgi:hypothetical protein
MSTPVATPPGVVPRHWSDWHLRYEPPTEGGPMVAALDLAPAKASRYVAGQPADFRVARMPHLQKLIAPDPAARTVSHSMKGLPQSYLIRPASQAN